MRGILASIVCAGLTIGTTAATAAAQPTRSVAVTMGAPAAVGVLWHLNGRVALRPDVTVSRSRIKTTTRSTISLPFQPPTTLETSSTQTDWTTSTGLSVLITLRDIERVRMYVVPRVSYLYSESSTTGLQTTLGGFNADTSGVGVSTSVGAHVTLGERAALFGEAGVSVTRQTFESGASTSSTKSRLTGVGLRSSVGLAVYF